MSVEEFVSNSMSAKQPLAIWDFTISARLSSEEEIRTWLITYGKKWVFQLERGEDTEYLHYQGRVSLISKTRKLRNKQWHFTFTSNPGVKTGFSYVMKEPTRVSGPWTDMDAPAYVPVAHRNPFVPNTWQGLGLHHIRTMDPRQILLIHSNEGNKGKTYFMDHLEIHCGWVNLPSTLSTANDVMKAAYALISHTRTPTGICMNIPKSMNKSHLWTLAQAIESLKDGKTYDERYAFKQWRFEPCPIVVCTNYVPDRKIFAEDRWIVVTAT